MLAVSNTSLPYHQVLLEEAVKLWLELVRPDVLAASGRVSAFSKKTSEPAAVSTGAPTVSEADALAVLERVRCLGIPRVLQSARRRKIERRQALLRAPSQPATPAADSLHRLGSGREARGGGGGGGAQGAADSGSNVNTFPTEKLARRIR